MIANSKKQNLGYWKAIRSGALSGIVSTLVFVYIHDILISDIWFSTIPMVIAGAICGMCLSWSYRLLFNPGTTKSWLGYNAVYFAMFVLLGVVSVLVFEPITSVAAVIAANEPPNELFGKALPMTVIYLLGMTAILSILFGKNWRHYGALFITCTVLILLLGLNIAVIGLVFIPMGSFYLILELFALIFLLDVVFLVSFLLLERKSLTANRATPDLERA